MASPYPRAASHRNGYVQRRAAGTVTGCSTRRRSRPPRPSSAPPIRTSRRSSRSHGLPEFWAREPGFPTLVLLILEQQVSLASAKAAYDRLAARIGRGHARGRPRARPTRSCARTDSAGRRTATSGRSPPRSSSGRSTSTRSRCSTTTASARRSSRSRGSARGRPRSTSSRPFDDRTPGRSATSPSRRRPGAPAGSTERPSPDELERIGEAWRPHRASAARLLWHLYLSEPRSIGRHLAPGPHEAGVARDARRKARRPRPDDRPAERPGVWI